MKRVMLSLVLVSVACLTEVAGAVRLPTRVPLNRPLGVEQRVQYMDQSWKPRCGYDRQTVERRRRYDFERALEYSQYADAWRLIKNKDVLGLASSWECLSEPLVEEMTWCGGGVGKDYIPLRKLPGGFGFLGKSPDGRTVRLGFDYDCRKKSAHGIKWSPRDYASVFRLVEEAVEQYTKKKDPDLADLFFCKDFLEKCDLWKHDYLLQSEQPPTTEMQRKAIRLWILQTLESFAKKVLSSPNCLRDPEGRESHLLRPLQAALSRFGQKTPKPLLSEEYRKEWFLWYGGVPEEMQRLERSSDKITELLTQLRALMDQKKAVQKEREAAKKAAQEAEGRLKKDPSLRK